MKCVGGFFFSKLFVWQEIRKMEEADDDLTLIDPMNAANLIFKQRLFVESSAVFVCARANAWLWKGKCIYEVVLETCGVQQLGIGDAEDSYAFDGRRVSKWNMNAAETYHHSRVEVVS